MAYVKTPGKQIARVSASTKQFTTPPTRMDAAFFAAAINSRPGTLAGGRVGLARERIRQPVKRIPGIPASPVKALKKGMLGFGESDWADPWASGLISDLPTAKRQVTTRQPTGPVADPRVPTIGTGWQSEWDTTGWYEPGLMANLPPVKMAGRQQSVSQPTAPVHQPRAPKIKGVPKSPVKLKPKKV